MFRVCPESGNPFIIEWSLKKKIKTENFKIWSLKKSKSKKSKLKISKSKKFKYESVQRVVIHSLLNDHWRRKSKLKISKFEVWKSQSLIKYQSWKYQSQKGEEGKCKKILLMYIATAHEEEKSAAEENLQDMWTQDGHTLDTGH